MCFFSPDLSRHFGATARAQLHRQTSVSWSSGSLKLSAEKAAGKIRIAKQDLWRDENGICITVIYVLCLFVSF